VEDIRAALGDDVDIAAQGPPQFSLSPRRDHLKLFDGVNAVGHAAQRRGVVVGGEPVNDEVVREIALAADRQTDAGDRRGLRKELRAPEVCRRHTRNEERQLEEVAAVERQAPHLNLRDRAGDLAASGLEHGGFSGHGHAGVERCDGQRHRQLERGARCQGEEPRRVPESRPGHRDLVRADPQVGETEPALLIGHRRTGHVRLGVPGRDLSASDHSTRGVGYPSADARVFNRLLRKACMGAREHAASESQSSHTFHGTPPQGNDTTRLEATRVPSNRDGRGYARGGGGSGDARRLIRSSRVWRAAELM
jgi:hypothetical protein